jgi:hypothetical protein
MAGLEKERTRVQEKGIDTEKAMNEARITAEKDISDDRNTMMTDVETLRTEAQEAIATERAELEADLQELRLEFAGDELDEKIAAREAQIGQAEAELIEKTDARKAQFTELSNQRRSDKSIREEANAIQRTGINNEKAIADANRKSEYDARDKDRAVKAWATEEDLKQREREYKQASKDKRLEMILQAVESDISTDKLKEFLQRYPITTPTGEVEEGPNGTPEPTNGTDDPPPGAPSGWKPGWTQDSTTGTWYDENSRMVGERPDDAPDGWQVGWYKEGGEWFNEWDEPMDVFKSDSTTTPTAEEEKAQWMTETKGNYADDWTKGDDGFWYDGDHSNSAKGEKTDYRHSTGGGGGEHYDEDNPPPGWNMDWRWDDVDGWIDEYDDPV